MDQWWGPEALTVTHSIYAQECCRILCNVLEFYGTHYIHPSHFLYQPSSKACKAVYMALSSFILTINHRGELGWDSLNAPRSFSKLNGNLKPVPPVVTYCNCTGCSLEDLLMRNGFPGSTMLEYYCWLRTYCYACSTYTYKCWWHYLSLWPRYRTQKYQ